MNITEENKEITPVSNLLKKKKRSNLVEVEQEGHKEEI